MNNIFIIFKAVFLGLLTGFVMSIPLGPAGIESIKRTISKGYREGFTVSLGALTADMTYLILINCGLSRLLQKNAKTEALFWIISGIILTFIGYNSIKSKSDSRKTLLWLTSGKREASFPFVAGFLITFSNPLTPSTWLFMSGTVIRAWYYVSTASYYAFIFSIIAGMVAWFALLNYLALRGFKFLTPSTSHKTTVLLMICIFIIGISFIIFGAIKLII